ncbi:hypothetical protein HN51_044421 [Arachis hypogaea]
MRVEPCSLLHSAPLCHCGVAWLLTHPPLTAASLTVMLALKHNLKVFNPPFDVVLATNVVYMRSIALDFCHGSPGVRRRRRVSRVLGEVSELHKKFWEMCDEVFDIKKAPRDHLYPEYAYEETGVFLLRKEKKKQ